MLLVLTGTLLCVGCDKKHNVSDFPLKPGLTSDQLEEMLGPPTKKDAHWVAYALADGTELRIYFVEGIPGATRTLTEATIYSNTGVRLKNVYMVPRLGAPIHPSTAPSAITQPTTQS